VFLRINEIRDVINTCANHCSQVHYVALALYELVAYLEKNGLRDFGYCGLSTALARQIEATCRWDNDAFAQRVWHRPWNKMFGDDTGQEFAPNDFDIRRPDFFTRRRLRRAIREMKTAAQEILKDPILTVEASCNDLRQQSG
jgi:hypothetical protein